jgi:hypothetical protein
MIIVTGFLPPAFLRKNMTNRFRNPENQFFQEINHQSCPPHLDEVISWLEQNMIIQCVVSTMKQVDQIIYFLLLKQNLNLYLSFFGHFFKVKSFPLFRIYQERKTGHDHSKDTDAHALTFNYFVRWKKLLFFVTRADIRNQPAELSLCDVLF